MKKGKKAADIVLKDNIYTPRLNITDFRQPFKQKNEFTALTGSPGFYNSNPAIIPCQQIRRSLPGKMN